MPALAIIVGLVVLGAVLGTLATRPAQRRARASARRARDALTGALERLERRFGAPVAVGIWYVGAFLLLLSLTVGAGHVVTRSAEGWLGDLDRAATSYFAEARTDTATLVMHIASDVGDSITLALVGIILGVAWRLYRDNWHGLAVLTVSFLGSVSLYTSGKQLVARDRPGAEFFLEETPGLAFPSGHTTGSTAFYVAAVLLIATLGIRWTVKVWALAAAVTVAALVAVSRVYLGAHWLSDVTFGAFLGTAWALVAVAPLWRARGAADAERDRADALETT